jgi:alpha-glucosidase
VTVPWWRSAVVYQIYPRSFADADADGVADLRGITRRLEHVRDLGAEAVWLSPICRSPTADFGYDIADHTDVDRDLRRPRRRRRADRTGARARSSCPF